ncbi:YadA-like family protein, partial [Acinetobacter puyangensis]|uniref:YadA-like family protein n=1 Tax=Acinetobacter puyangensis TaxID=1096779 RepID=UPI003A4D34D2
NVDGSVTGPFTTNGNNYDTIADAIEAESAASKTEVEQGKNITVTSEEGADGQTIYTVATAADVNFNTVTVGDASGSPITLDGTTGTITGLSNTTLGTADFATAGRAATEEQLSSVSDSVSNIIGGGVTNNGGSVTGPVNVGGDSYTTIVEAIEDQSAKAKTTVSEGDNIVVTKTENADGSDNYEVATAKDVNFDSVTVGDTYIDNSGVSTTNLTVTGDTKLGDNFVVNNEGVTYNGPMTEGNHIVNKDYVDNSITELSDTPLTFAGNTGSVDKKLGDTVTIKGEGTKDDDQYSAENIKTIVDGDGNLVVALDKNLSADSVTLNGQNGADGISLIGAAGAAGVNGQDGITRIIYTDPTTGDEQQVATLNDGLKFAGNTGDTIAKKLNETLTLKGGLADEAKATAANTRVDSENGELVVKLAKNLTDLTSATFTTPAGDSSTIINGNGITITPIETAPNGLVSLTKDGLNNGGNQITNVASGGTTETNAANIGDVKAAAAAAKTEVEQGKNITVKSETGDDGQTVYTVATADDVNFDSVTVGNVVLDSTSNTISGLSNTTLGGADFATAGRAATEEQLNATQNNLVTVLGGNAVNNAGNVTTNNIGNTGKNNIHDAIDSVRQDAVNANQGWNVSTNGGTASNVKPGNTVDFKGDGSVVVSNDGNNVTVGLADKVTVGSGDNAVSIDGDSGQITVGNTTVAKDGITTGDTTLNDSGLTIAGGPSVTKDGIDAGDKTITGVDSGLKDADGKVVDLAKADGNNAVNVDDLRTTVNDINSNVAAAKTEVKAGSNITVTPTKGADGQAIYEVATAKDVTFDSVTSGTVEADKVTVGNVVIDQSGINAGDQKVTNVAAGTVSETSKDAVNGSQLYGYAEGVKNIIGGTTTYNPETGQYTNTNIGGTGKDNINDAIGAVNNNVIDLGNRLENAFYQTNKRIDKVDREAKAGIASAMAMETAPFIAGKLTYAVGAAHHGGEQAVGATLRKTADNGRWAITGGIATATEGDPSFRIGISGVID